MKPPVVRMTWTAEENPTPEQVEAFRAFLTANHALAFGGGVVSVAGVVWASKVFEIEEPIEQADLEVPV